MLEIYCPLCCTEHECRVVGEGSERDLYYCEYAEDYFLVENGEE